MIEWLALSNGGNPSTVLGQAYLILQLGAISSRVGTTGFTAIVLAIFLLLEHIITQADATGRFISGKQFVEILTFSSLESAIWVVWLKLITVNEMLAITFFLLRHLVQHEFADNRQQGQSGDKLSSTTLLITG